MKNRIWAIRTGCIILIYALHSQFAIAQQVTLKIKGNIFADHYFPSLSKHFPSAGLEPSDKVTNFIPYQIIGEDAKGAKPDVNGMIRIKAAEMPYYKLDGLQLYIEPGDELQLDLKEKRYPSEVVFYGRHATANKWLNQEMFINYMQLTPFNTRFDTSESYRAYRNMILKNAATKKRDLDKIIASKNFKEDALMRLDFLTISALLNYWSFNLEMKFASRMHQDSVSDEKTTARANAFYNEKHDSLMTDVKSLMPDEYKIRYNDLPQVINALEAVSKFDSEYITEARFPGFLELHNMKKAIVASGDSKFFYSDQINGIAASVQDTGLKKIAQQWQKVYGNLQPKRPAIDIILRDEKGQVVKLSDFKGKPIYADIWATWCGPCIMLKPEFEKMAEHYKDSNVVFISISTDKNMSQWKSYLAQHKSASNIQEFIVEDGEAFSQSYEMQFIPRFLLIDKQFKFISALAPRPYELDIKKWLDAITINN